ncbi:uncharacterized protein LOC117383663 isoform X2 [Periophthalmus magnuspinnatus]|uniref:uncharacterized protein LOC117383663 isoform X2 n=1 Tax=Periophthalmus magnuspinnatus TaxID=409849 RepID=UPI00243672AD|nr:uncharacterized protein LOC117383663 isoform X2 [Periophthalmus magnuspinnatus]
MQFRADEAAVVEKAVRLAVESVMNVLSAVNSARTNELQRLVADKEQEIRRLEERVREAEGELRLLRRWWSPNGAPEQSGGDPENSAEQRECEVRVSLALMTGSPSQEPTDGMDLDQTCSSKDRTVSVPVSQPLPCPPESPVQKVPLCPPETPVQKLPLGSPEGQVQQPPLCPSDVPQEPNCPSDGRALQETQCPVNRQVKQEALFPSPAQIKQEPFCPDYGYVQQEDSPAVFLQRDMSEEVSPSVQDILGHSELWQSVSLGAEDVPVTVSVPHSVPGLRGKTTLARRDQSEEAMRRRRASWRAASRRYYARKMARLHTHTANSSGPGTSVPLFPPCPGPQGNMIVQLHSQPHSQPWGVSSRGYSSCELVQDPLRHPQDPQRPPAHS